jgi:hypothetical protein
MKSWALDVSIPILVNPGIENDSALFAKKPDPLVLCIHAGMPPDPSFAHGAPAHVTAKNANSHCAPHEHHE